MKRVYTYLCRRDPKRNADPHPFARAILCCCTWAALPGARRIGCYMQRVQAGIGGVPTCARLFGTTATAAAFMRFAAMAFEQMNLALGNVGLSLV